MESHSDFFSVANNFAYAESELPTDRSPLKENHTQKKVQNFVNKVSLNIYEQIKIWLF